MEIKFLGTGASPGVPMLACTCKVCKSRDPRNKRLRASILVQNGHFNILVDTSTDLRQQCLTHQIQDINAILFTHHHADHILGMEELRAFNFIHQKIIPCYGREETFAEIKKIFRYIFQKNSSYKGSISQVDLNIISNSPFNLGGIKITPLDIIHGNLTICGYKFDSCAYITDCSEIPEHTQYHLRNLDLLILNALRYEPHPTHLNFERAIEWVNILKPKRALFTHMNHQIEYKNASQQLPKNVEIAYDGMLVTL